MPAVRHYSTRSQSVFGPASCLLSDTTAPGPSQSLALHLACCQTLQHQVPVSPDTTAPGPSQSLALHLACCSNTLCLCFHLLIFTRAVVNIQHQVPVDRCSRHFTGCQSKKGLFSSEPLLFSVSLMVPCHHTCHHVSLYTFLLALSDLVPVRSLALHLRHYSTRSQSVQTLQHQVPVSPDTTAPGPSQSLALHLACCQTLQHQVPVSGNFWALVTSHFLCSGSPCLKQPSCSHPTLKFSHCSDLLLKPFSLLLCYLISVGYSNPTIHRLFYFCVLHTLNHSQAFIFLCLLLTSSLAD